MNQAVLIMRRKASIINPLHAVVQGAIERLSSSDRNVSLCIVSTELGILFCRGINKHKSCEGLNSRQESQRDLRMSRHSDQHNC